jgi:hypothetical protein
MRDIIKLKGQLSSLSNITTPNLSYIYCLSQKIWQVKLKTHKRRSLTEK